MVYNALPTLIDAPNPPPQINTRRHIVKTPVKRKKRKSYKINNNSLINILKQNLILIAVEEKNTDSLTDTAGEEEEPYANCLKESLKCLTKTNALPTLIDAPNPPPQINTRRHIVKTPVKRKKRKSYKINNNSLINILKQNLILIAVEEKNTDSLTDTAGEEEEPYANCLNESLKSSSLLLDKDKEIMKLKSRNRYQSQQICHLRKSISKLHSKVFRLKRKCKGNSKLIVSPKSNNLKAKPI